MKSALRISTLFTVGALALTGATACGASSDRKESVALVAYSTPQKVYDKLIPAFQATAAGKGSTFSESYGASGSQARAVVAGQAADVVEFSLQTDMDNLVKARLVAPDWNRNQYQGMVSDSVVTLVVRKGNPLHIHDWNDLTKPGVQIVTPNPLSSGSARWNLMAAYGSQIKQGKSPVEALAFVRRILQHTVSQPSSGSQATSAFASGTGNVLISYENEAIAAQQAGEPIDFVTPPDTLLIENPIAVTTDAKDPTLARAFVQYLYSDAGQRTFARLGYRPVVKADFDPRRFPIPSQLFTIQDLGGWDAVAKQFFDSANGSITKLESAAGASGG